MKRAESPKSEKKRASSRTRIAQIEKKKKLSQKKKHGGKEEKRRKLPGNKLDVLPEVSKVRNFRKKKSYITKNVCRDGRRVTLRAVRRLS